MAKNRIKKWLATYSSVSTQKVYLWGLRAFFETNDEAILFEKAEKYLDECLSKTRDQKSIEDDFYAFVDRITKKPDGKTRPPKSVWSMVTAVRIFLQEYDVVLNSRFWLRLKQRKLKGRVEAMTEDHIPSNAEIRRLLSHMPPQGKALFRLVATSGSRIGAVLNLKVKDVVLEHETLAPHIRKRAESTKTGKKHVAFMTPEAKADIEKWLEVRKDYIKTAVSRSKWRPQYGIPKEEWKGKQLSDNRLFPFQANTAYAIWKRAAKIAGLYEIDENTGRASFHPHVLRKWCRTRLGTVLPLDVAEALIGHEGYLTKEYRRHTLQELSDFYVKAQEVLFLEVDVSVDRLNSKVKEQAEQLKVVTIQQATRIAGLEQQARQLEETIQERVREEMAIVVRAFTSAIRRIEDTESLKDLAVAFAKEINQET